MTFNLLVRRIIQHPLFIILALIGVAHFALLLDDGLHYDSLTYYRFIAGHDWDVIYHAFRNEGYPQLAYYFYAMGFAPNVILAFRLVAMMCIVLIALLTYALAGYYPALTTIDRTLIATFTVIYPAYQVYNEHSMSVALVCYVLFLFAWWLLFVSANRIRAVQIIARIVSALCFLYSFSIASFLVFYFGFLALYLLWRFLQNGARTLQNLLRIAIAHTDLIALPLIFWFGSRALWPLAADVSDYNQINLANPFSVARWSEALKNTVWLPISESLNGTAAWLVLIGILIGAAWLLPLLKRASDGSIQFVLPRKFHFAAMLLIGLVLLLLGVFPYVAVAKIPQPHGWDSRLALLVGLPMALIIVATLRLLFTQNTGAYNLTGAVVVLILVSAFCKAQFDQYVSWTWRWAKDRSFVLNLARLDGAQKISTFEVDNQFEPLAGDDIGWYLKLYWPYSWTALIQNALGAGHNVEYPQASAIYARTRDSLFSRQFYLGSYDASGCYARVTIRRATGAAQMGAFGIARRYWYYRFISPSGMDEFLRGLTQLQLTPISDPRATHCS